MKKYLMIIAVLGVVIFASGCIDTGNNVNNTSNQSSQITIPLTNKLVLNITDSDSSKKIYAVGDKVNITFTPQNQSFVVYDKNGKSSGNYNVSGDIITLNFGDSQWILKLAADGSFNATKGDAKDTGTYAWVYE